MRTILLLISLVVNSLLNAQTTLPGTINSGGLLRDYLLYKPAVYTGNAPVPVVINLHGYGSNNVEQLFYGDFRPFADTANFLIVLPNGTLDGQGKRFFNTFGTGSTVDDVAFIDNLLDTLEATYNIDVNRIYATGMSNGGFMSYALACGLNDRITAIGSVTGSMITANLNACNPVHPVPVMEIHGTADATVPYNGSTVNGFVAIPTLVNAWVNFNHCDPTPVQTTVPNTNTADGSTAEHYVYSGGDQGSTVEHFKIIGGGHTWPGAAFNVGVTNQDINASREIWRFFNQYRLNQLTATRMPITSAINWSASPNPVDGYLMLHADKQQPVQQIQIYDTAGRLKQTLRPSASNNIRVETANWPKGVYYLIITQEGKIEQLQVVK